MKNKVVLFHGGPSSFRRINIAPLALLHISPFLVRDGLEVKIISDILYDKCIEETLKQCENSVCLGVTAFTGPQIAEGLKISSLVKKKYPELPIVWGGWHPSIAPISTLQDPNVDMVVVGPGAVKFYEIVKILRESAPAADLGKIDGVYFKKDNQVIANSNFSFIDVNSIPSIPYDIINVEKCLDPTEYGVRTIQYISSYGCPAACAFCVDPIINKRRWAGFPAKRVVDEWEYLHRRYGIDSIAVYDSNFFVDKKRVIDICVELLGRNLNIKWGNANGRIPQLAKYEDSVWELMSRAGLRMILTGAESAEQETLDLINKGARIEDIYEFTSKSARHNIKVLFSYMSGMPWSNDKKFNENRVNLEIKNILSQINRLLKTSRKNRFMICIYTPLPGSVMYEKAKRYGFNEPKTLREWSALTFGPEDIFENREHMRGWITRKQAMLVTILEQYIFGLMDLDARGYMAKSIKNRFLQILFKGGFTIGYAIARIRLKTKIFLCPIDFWLFVRFRRLMGVF